MASLLALARAEQEAAKRRFRFRLYAHLLTLVLSVVALFVQGTELYLVGLVVLVSNVTAWYFRWSAAESHVTAESGRRRAILARELGSFDALGTAEIMTMFSRRARREAHHWEDENYYSTSTQPPGPERLRMALQESAFWSARLYRLNGRRAAFRLAGIVVLIMTLVFTMVLLASASAAVFAVRTAIVTLTALIGVDELGSMLASFAAARMADRVSRQLENVDTGNMSEMTSIFTDYAVSTASTPPIPTRLYLRNHDDIEQAWTDRVGKIRG